MSVFSRLFRRSAASLNSSFLDSAQLLTAIEAEQSRTGRTGIPFCVVRFVPESSDTGRVVSVMERERRHTDSLGWWKDGRPTAVLVATSTDGGDVYGERIRRLSGSRLPFEVEAYPRPDSSRATTEEAKRAEVPIGAAPAANAAGGGSLLYAPPSPLWKSLFDRGVGALVLALLSPLFLLVAAWIKAVSPGPVFFRQERVGRGGRRFQMWKFRSLEVDSSSHHRDHVKSLIHGGGVLQKIDGALPVIRGGRFLRASCIDELPQLINVVLGDMSLVGPRPLPSYEAEEFAPWQGERHRAVPGLTGLWQVSGKNRLTFEQMIRLDIRYGRRRTLRQDLVIVVRTFPVLFESIKGTSSDRLPITSGEN